MNDEQNTNEANAVGEPVVGDHPTAAPASGAASGSALVEKLRTALVALLVSDRNTVALSDEEILGIMTSKDAKEVPILMERANAIYKARLAVKAASAFLNIRKPQKQL